MSGHWRRKLRGEGGGGILRTWRTHGAPGGGTVSVRKGPAGSTAGAGVLSGTATDVLSWACAVSTQEMVRNNATAGKRIFFMRARCG